MNQTYHPPVNGGLEMNNGSQAGHYSGTDRYYRQSKPQWQNNAGTTNFDQDYLVYDRMGNLLSDNSNPSSTGGQSNFDQTYTYDGLNRLSRNTRGGTVSSGTIARPKFSRAGRWMQRCGKT